MKPILAAFLCFVFVLISSESEGGWLGPSDYDECILDSMKGVTSDEAAKLIKHSCRRKFRKKYKSAETRPLSHDELTKITGGASIKEKADWEKAVNPGPKQSLNGYIVNENENVTVVGISVEITTTYRGEKVSRTYTSSVISDSSTMSAGPLSTANFYVDFIGDEGASFSWGIVGATGY